MSNRSPRANRRSSRSTGILPVSRRGILPLLRRFLHGQDARGTHGQDAHATGRGALRVAVLAVGSRLRGDDAAGLLATEELSRILRRAGIARRTRRACIPARGKRGLYPAPFAGDCPRFPPPKVAVFLGETAPENMTGRIKRFRPTHLVILDAADMAPLRRGQFRRRPGAVAVFDPDQVAGDTLGSTHSLPLTMLAEYLRHETGCQAVIVGIQPAHRDFGRPPSASVLAAARKAAEMIASALVLR